MVHVEKLKLLGTDERENAADSKVKPHINDHVEVEGELLVPADLVANDAAGFEADKTTNLETETSKLRRKTMKGDTE